MNPSEICIILSYDSNYQAIANVSTKNVENYCRLHGYSFLVDKQENIDNDRGAQWHKIKISLETLQNSNYKWVFFLDADCLIMNPSVKLESLLDDKYSFIVPAHNTKAIDTPVINSQGTETVITSQFIVQNTDIGKEILQDIWDAPDWPENMHLNTFDYEQRQARITINKEKFKEHCNVIEEKLLNRFWIINSPHMIFSNPYANNNVWQIGDFIVHVTGYPLPKRAELMSDLYYFVGGSIGGWRYQKNSISFSPLKDLEQTTIKLYDRDGNLLVYYDFANLEAKLVYCLFFDNQNKLDEIIIKSFDSNSKIIGEILLVLN